MESEGNFAGRIFAFICTVVGGVEEKKEEQRGLHPRPAAAQSGDRFFKKSRDPAKGQLPVDRPPSFLFILCSPSGKESLFLLAAAAAAIALSTYLN